LKAEKVLPVCLNSDYIIQYNELFSLTLHAGQKGFRFFVLPLLMIAEGWYPVLYE